MRCYRTMGIDPRLARASLSNWLLNNIGTQLKNWLDSPYRSTAGNGLQGPNSSGIPYVFVRTYNFRQATNVLAHLLIVINL
jgi:hypothetical protein